MEEEPTSAHPQAMLAAAEHIQAALGCSQPFETQVGSQSIQT